MANKTAHIFFNNFIRKTENYDKYYRVFELTKDCTTVDEIRELLVDNGFELMDTERGAREPMYKYADNDRTVVKTWYNGRFEIPLSVSVSEHSFDSVRELRGFHKSFEEIVNMTPAEMQE